jgi:outer membrane protein TolC
LALHTQSTSRGLNYGFSALNLFDGFAQNRNEKIAGIQIENSKMQIEQQSLALSAQLVTAYQTYLTNLELIDLEKNEVIAKQNLDITLDKFRIGTITTLEFRTAQLNYVNAKVRYSNAQFQAKTSEIALRELAGNLVFRSDQITTYPDIINILLPPSTKSRLVNIARGQINHFIL